jgi:excisionase family DNA binding protein
MAIGELLNVRETARELGVHENTVRNLEQRGELRAVRLPGSGFRRFRKEDIDRMRREMLSQFAPDTPMPAERRRPKKRRTLTAEDYSG